MNSIIFAPQTNRRTEDIETYVTDEHNNLRHLWIIISRRDAEFSRLSELSVKSVDHIKMNKKHPICG